MMNRASLFCLAGAYICLSAYAQVKMSPSGDHSDIIKVDMTARRPCTEGPEFKNPFMECVVPENKEVNPGAGIRVNGDTESAADENDLIKIELKVDPFPVPTGVNCILKRSNSNINVWDGQTMGAAILNSGTEATITFSAATKTLWVENPRGGDADLELVARSGGTDICSDKVHFYPFTSIVIALGGMDQVPADPVNDPGNQGVFETAIDLYRQGYDVHMYDEDKVHNGGVGDPYDEVIDAFEMRGVTNLAIYGYSRGGGAVYDLAEGLHLDESIDAAITVWIDAIESGLIAHSAETRRPPGSNYHLNYYQSHDGGPLNSFGDQLQHPQPLDFQINVTELGWVDAGGNLLSHHTIDDDGRVTGGVQSSIHAVAP